MRKAISLKVSLWIEGEDEPAHDFAASTKQAVREIIEAGASKHPELKVTIKNLGERGVDDSPKPKPATKTPPAADAPKTGGKG
ncbi:MAG: hypothetical protein ACJ741_14665 [Pyrinomonadaceae bacterium]